MYDGLYEARLEFLTPVSGHSRCLDSPFTCASTRDSYKDNSTMIESRAHDFSIHLRPRESFDRSEFDSSIVNRLLADDDIVNEVTYLAASRQANIFFSREDGARIWKENAKLSPYLFLPTFALSNTDDRLTILRGPFQPTERSKTKTLLM